MANGPSTTTPPLNPNIRKLQERMGELFDHAADNAGGAASTVMQQVSTYAPVVLAAIERFRRPAQQAVRDVVAAGPRPRLHVGLKWPLIAIIVTGAAAYVAGRMAGRPAAVVTSRPARRQANVA